VDPELRIQVGERFVKKENPGPDNDRPGQGDPLLFPSRELVGKLTLVTLEPGEGEYLHDRPVDIPLLHPLDSQAIGHVLIDRKMREKGVVLEDKTDVPLIGHQIRNVIRSDMDTAAVRSFESGNHPESGGLSAARWAEERQELAGLDLKAHVVDRRDLAFHPVQEGPREMVQTDAYGFHF
jgi:hypothetical protein